MSPTEQDITTTTTTSNKGDVTLLQGDESHIYETTKDAAFCTQLMTACWLGKKEVDAFLQEHQDHEHDLGRLVDLMRRNFAKCCQVLPLNKICLLRLRMGPWLLRDEEYSDWTPMHYACARFDLPILQYILRRGGSLRRPRPRCGTTPLHWLGRTFRRDLIYNGYAYDDEKAFVDVVNWILHYDAPALFLTNHKGVSALEKILERASFSVLQVLMVRLVCGRGATTTMVPKKERPVGFQTNDTESEEWEIRS